MLMGGFILFCSFFAMLVLVVNCNDPKNIGPSPSIDQLIEACQKLLASKPTQWVEFLETYHRLDDIIHTEGKQDHPAIQGALKSLHQLANDTLSKDIQYPLDYYSIYLPWHKDYEGCKEEFSKSADRLYENFNPLKDLKLEHIDDEIGHRLCLDFTNQMNKRLTLIKSLVHVAADELAKPIHSKNVPTKLLEQLEDLVKKLDDGSEKIKPVIYFETLSLIQYLLKNNQSAMQTLVEGLEDHKDNWMLMNILAEMITNRFHYQYKGVLESELPGLYNSIGDDSCRWDNDLLSLDTWEDAQSKLKSIVEKCKYPKDLENSIITFMHIYLLIGQMKFQEAHNYYRSAGTSTASELRRLVNTIREDLVKQICQKAKPSSPDKPLSIANVIDKVDKLLQIRSNRAEEKRKTQEAKQLREADEAKKKIVQQNLIEDRKKEEQRRLDLLSAKSITSSDTPTTLVEDKKLYGDRKVGEEELIKCKELVNQGEYYEACKHYKVADREYHYTDVHNDRDSILESILKTQPFVDESKLCYGGSINYSQQKVESMERKSRTLAFLRNLDTDIGLDSDNIFNSLKSPNLIDLRPSCEQRVDVAELLAEAFYFDMAIKVVNDYCFPVAENTDARIVGAFAKGLTDAQLDSGNTQVINVLNYVQEKLPSHSSFIWKAAVLDLHKALWNQLNDNFRPLFLFEDAIKLFPTIHNLKTVVKSDLDAALSNCKGNKCIQFLPIIEKFFNILYQQKGQKLKAWSVYSQLLYQYHKKMGNHYQALEWYEEAFKNRSLTENQFLYQERANLEQDIKVSYDTLLQKDSDLTNLVRKVEGGGLEAAQTLSSSTAIVADELTATPKQQKANLASQSIEMQSDVKPNPSQKTIGGKMEHKYPQQQVFDIDKINPLERAKENNYSDRGRSMSPNYQTIESWSTRKPNIFPPESSQLSMESQLVEMLKELSLQRDIKEYNVDYQNGLNEEIIAMVLPTTDKGGKLVTLIKPIEATPNISSVGVQFATSLATELNYDPQFFI